MNALYVCGSFRFTEEMDALEKRLRGEGIDCLTYRSHDSQGIQGCFRKIDEADVVYVVNPRGYVERSVCVDIGYAYANNKSIYAMHQIEDSSIRQLVADVLNPDEMVKQRKE